METHDHEHVERVERVESAPASDGNSFLLGIILLVVVVLILFYFGLPFMRGSSGGGTQINVPKQIDINTNQK